MGRSARPRRPTPQAIAPLVTSTGWCPWRRTRTRSRTRASRTSSRRRPRGVDQRRGPQLGDQDRHQPRPSSASTRSRSAVDAGAVLGLHGRVGPRRRVGRVGGGRDDELARARRDRARRGPRAPGRAGRRRLRVGGVHRVQDDPRALELLQARVGPRRPVGRQAREVGDQVEVAVGVLQRPEGRLARRLRVGPPRRATAPVRAASSALLPLLGRPTMATSTGRRSSRVSQASSPAPPGTVVRGAWWVEERKARLPIAAVAAARHRHPVAGRRQLGDAVAVAHHPRARRARPPAGRRRRGRGAPCPRRGRRPGARWCTAWRNRDRSVTWSSATSTTLPPRPPLPPSGPPARGLRLAPERQAAVAAVATLHVDLRPIGEGHRRAGP